MNMPLLEVNPLSSYKTDINLGLYAENPNPSCSQHTMFKLLSIANSQLKKNEIYEQTNVHTNTHTHTVQTCIYIPYMQAYMFIQYIHTMHIHTYSTYSTYNKQIMFVIAI